jgi:hypothetical protein
VLSPFPIIGALVHSLPYTSYHDSTYARFPYCQLPSQSLLRNNNHGCCCRLLIFTRPTHDGSLLLFKIIGSDGGRLMLSNGVNRKLYVVVEQTTPTGIFCRVNAIQSYVKPTTRPRQIHLKTWAKRSQDQKKRKLLVVPGEWWQDTSKSEATGDTPERGWWWFLFLCFLCGRCVLIIQGSFVMATTRIVFFTECGLITRLKNLPAIDNSIAKKKKQKTNICSIQSVAGMTGVD